MKIILVRPPRYLWPVINESDNYMMPLGLPCLAAVIRERMPDKAGKDYRLPSA
ncbi:MAG: hypothetical protein RAP41_01140 [Candidatus Orphnella occulta]|nr:hypothetical protein [Candidatus Orphnella occulta]